MGGLMPCTPGSRVQGRTVVDPLLGRTEGRVGLFEFFKHLAGLFTIGLAVDNAPDADSFDGRVLGAGGDVEFAELPEFEEGEAGSSSDTTTARGVAPSTTARGVATHGACSFRL